MPVLTRPSGSHTHNPTLTHMFKLQPPNAVAVTNRAKAERACNLVRAKVQKNASDVGMDADAALESWVRTHDFASYAMLQVQQSAGPSGGAEVSCKWLDRHVYHVLGLAGYARAVLGLLSADDVRALAPHPDTDDEAFKFERDSAGGAAKYDQATVDDWVRRNVGEASSIVASRGFQGSDRDGKTPQPLGAEQRHLYQRAADDLAQRLMATQRVGWTRDDMGSRVGSSALAGWAGGAYATPLVEPSNTQGRVAVSILVDISGSTHHIAPHLWALASTLRSALIGAGHACAVDAWDDRDRTVGDGAEGGTLASPVVCNWGEVGDKWISPPRTGDGTSLRDSGTPAMGRLQATAPAGMRQAVLVLTDGATSPEDRAQFLELCACPAAYWEVEPRQNAAVDPSYGDARWWGAAEGWAAGLKTSCYAAHVETILQDDRLAAMLGAERA